VLALAGVGLAAWLIVGAFSELAFRIRLFDAPLAESFRRLRGLPRSSLGTTLAHAGLGVTVLGIVAATAWSTENILTMKPGAALSVAGYTLTLDGFVGEDGTVTNRPVDRPGPNYSETLVRFSVRDGDVLVRTMEPAKRSFAVRQTTTSESALANFWPSELYISLGDIGDDGATTVRVYWKPLVTLIWLGAVVMALGGLLSLSDRRLRVGAPRPARAPLVAAAE